jgi:putative transcriptional regulator
VWLTCDPDEVLVFGDDYEAKWSRALAKLGITAGAISTPDGHRLSRALRPSVRR